MIIELAFGVIALSGIAVHAAAGTAAAATGYYAYGVPSTGHGLSLGALAGVMQSAILFFIEYVLFSLGLWPRGPLESLVRALVCGVILSLPITAAVSNLAIGGGEFKFSSCLTRALYSLVYASHGDSLLTLLIVPGAFLAAGCVAALPLPAEFLGILPCESFS